MNSSKKVNNFPPEAGMEIIHGEYIAA